MSKGEGEGLWHCLASQQVHSDAMLVDAVVKQLWVIPSLADNTESQKLSKFQTLKEIMVTMSCVMNLRPTLTKL